ncbi:MAG: HEAT repeat domain-containing protein [Myxococcales bacterium]|nr:HEAT repeat domain-containing protein [Myxococcales bacterium]MCB9649417.1 HEAT repeat domain-containing protein [Deltaproteobacteria bacterium]
MAHAPNVFDFSDVRAYLRAHVEESAALDPEGGVRALARRAALSPGFLSNVLAGRRNLSERSVEALVGGLALEPLPAQGFRILARLSWCVSVDDRAHLTTQLEALARRAASTLNETPLTRALRAGRAGRREETQWLIGQLEAADPELRRTAAWALDRARDPRALEALVEALGDPTFEVRSAAGWALVHLGDIVAPRMLTLMSTTTCEDTREMASLVLLHLGRPPGWSVVDLLMPAAVPSY